MTSIRFKQVCKRFGATVAVDNVTLDIPAGELFFLLGPSGCGKTTLLRMLAGFVQPDQGDVYFGDQRINDLPPRSRNASMVFQAYALWPHMSVAKNVAYGLHVRGVPRAEVIQRVEKALKLVRLEGLGERRPNQLSGGQQQRVALARALVIEPQVLLLDEPLSNLDARLRDEMREEIRRLHQETGLTMVYVTHDQKEALTLADRLALLQQGRLIQTGPPQEVYSRPATRFVAGFLGDSNFVPGTVQSHTATETVVDTPLGPLVGIASANPPAKWASVVCSIRPHALTLDAGSAAANSIAAKVQQVTFLGELLQLRVLAGEVSLEVVSLPHLAGRLRAGDAVGLSVPSDQVVILQDTP
jgi:iron(III) transport system ATP-binding protein